MPSFNASLAWAAPIAVNHLGAHLQAFLEAIPKTDMLRLCNCFGKGKKAYITKLPIELIDRIAEEIIHHHRISQHVIWDLAYRCWLERCEPIDHLDESEIKQIYHELNGKFKRVTTAWRNGDYMLKTLPELTDDQIEEVAEFLQNSNTAEMENMNSADANPFPRHEMMQDAWFEKTGYPGHGCRGWLGHRRADLIRYFGLEVWNSHTYRSCGVCAHPDCARSNTITYLTLPVPLEHRMTSTWQQRTDEVGDERPTEVGFGTHVAIPSKPRKTLMAAFPRAMKILGLEISDLLGDPDQIGALEEDLDKQAEKAIWVDKQGVEHSSEWPKLMLLTTHS